RRPRAGHGGARGTRATASHSRRDGPRATGGVRDVRGRGAELRADRGDGRRAGGHGLLAAPRRAQGVRAARRAVARARGCGARWCAVSDDPVRWRDDGGGAPAPVREWLATLPRPRPMTAAERGAAAAHLAAQARAAGPVARGAQTAASTARAFTALRWFAP